MIVQRSRSSQFSEIPSEQRNTISKIFSYLEIEQNRRRKVVESIRRDKVKDHQTKRALGERNRREDGNATLAHSPL